MIVATALGLVLLQGQDINQQIGDAIRRGDWATVGALQLRIINRTGFSYGNAKAYIHALNQVGRADEAAAVAKTWIRPQNEPDCYATYADALINIGDYITARTSMKKLVGINPKDKNAADYLDYLRDAVSMKTYELVWQLQPKETAKMKSEWFAPPQNAANQRLKEITISGGKFGEERTDTHGNKLKLIIPEAGAVLTVRAVVELSPFSVLPELSKIKGETPEDVKSYLKPSSGINPETAECKAFARPLLTRPLAERIKAVMETANNSLTYCPPGSPPGLDSSVECMKRGGGHCESLSMAICAYLRAVGVPARMIRGQSAISGASGVMKQHTIPEYYLPGVGWRDWDHRMRPFKTRDNFVRLGSYAGAPTKDTDPMFFFQGREFSGPNVYKNGPYKFKLLGRSMD